MKKNKPTKSDTRRKEKELLRAARAKRDAIMDRFVIVFEDGSTISAGTELNALDTTPRRPRASK